MSELISKYRNGNYDVSIFSDGTKIRSTTDDEFRPSFPETIDVNISQRCNCGCKFCYANCTKNGPKADLKKYSELLNTIHPYTEIAINCNDPEDADLVPFLKQCQERKIIVNMTINQVHFMKHYSIVQNLIKQKLVYGVGVSLKKVTNQFIELVKSIPNVVIHTIVGVTTPNDFKALYDVGLKILILGYKKIGRGVEFLSENNKQVHYNTAWLKGNIDFLFNRFDVVSFDNLSLKQLDIKKVLSPDQFKKVYMGDEGHFSFYLNLVNDKFYTSSLKSESEGHPITESVVKMFKTIRNENTCQRSQM